MGQSRRNEGLEKLIVAVDLNLDERFLEYAEHMLQDGPTLYDLIRRNIDLTGGRLVGLVPAEATDSQRYSFEGGGLNISLMRSLELNRSPRSVLAELIKSYLSVGRGRVGIIPDSMARASDSLIAKEGWRDVWRLKVPPRVWLYGEEVNWAMLPSDDVTFVEDTISLADFTPFVGVLGSLPVAISSDLVSGAKLTYSTLELIVSHGDAVFFGAYDGESFVFWRKTKPEWPA